LTKQLSFPGVQSYILKKLKPMDECSAEWYSTVHMQLPKRKPGKYAHTKHDPLVTQSTLEALEKKLATLKHKRPKAAAEVARLAELGDFSENVEYQMAKGRLRGINSRILKLEYEINHAEIIEPNKHSDAVEIGHRVTVVSDGVEKTYHILGSTETNPTKGIISHNSPLGGALLGKMVGSTFSIEIGGKKKEYTVIAIA
jgi:transcription elongation factor GreA